MGREDGGEKNPYTYKTVSMKNNNSKKKFKKNKLIIQFRIN